MAHEMMTSDLFVGFKQPAWHGLGRVTETEITNLDMLRQEVPDFFWEVEQWALAATNGETRMPVTTHRLNVRSDTKTPLGVVGEGYVPCQNKDLAALAFDIAHEAGGRVETVGTFRSGRRVYLSLSGVRFDAGGNPADPIDTFLTVVNGHDGGLAVRALTTSVRVVCSNTFHAALGSAGREIRFRHTAKMVDRISEVRRVLGVFQKDVGQFKKQAETLSAKSVDRKAVNDFFVEAYTRAICPIPKEPTTAAETRQRETALEAYNTFTSNFDRDVKRTGAAPSLWHAFNAFTEYLQYSVPVRAKDDARAVKRAESDLFGQIADRKASAMATALLMV